jgi:hypothetical protein
MIELILNNLLIYWDKIECFKIKYFFGKWGLSKSSNFNFILNYLYLIKVKIVYKNLIENKKIKVLPLLLFSFSLYEFLKFIKIFSFNF